MGDGTALLEVLQRIALDETARASDRIAAARELLDRRFGKPPSFDLVFRADASDDGFVETDLDAAIRDILDRIARQPRELPRS